MTEDVEPRAGKHASDGKTRISAQKTLRCSGSCLWSGNESLGAINFKLTR